MAKISEVGRSKTQDTPPDHGTNTEHDPLLEGQPVEYIKHVGRFIDHNVLISLPKIPVSSFIHSDYFYSASSSSLLLGSAPDTARILCRSFTLKRHRQL